MSTDVASRAIGRQPKGQWQRASTPLALMLLTAAGCAPALDEFSVEDSGSSGRTDAGTPGRDAGELDAGVLDARATDGRSDGPSADGPRGQDAGRTRDGGAVDAAGRWADAPPRGGCPMPQLLVGLQVDDDGLGRRGKVARYGLYPTVERCTDLTGEGRIPFRPDAVAWIPPNTVITAGDRGVVAVDIETDAVLWDHELDPFSAFSTFPLDAFPIAMPSGETRTAVSFTYPGPSDIAFLRIYDNGGAEIREWDVRDASWPVEEDTYAMTARPRRTGKLLSFTQLAIAREVDPFDGTSLPDPFVPPPNDYAFLTLQSYDDGLFVRSTWVGGDSSGHGVFFLDNDGESSSNPPFGPIRCRGRSEDRHPCTLPEELHDAVADPTALGRFFAVCQGSEGYQNYHVVRFDNRGAPCEVLLNDGALEGIDRAVTRLAIAVP